MVDHAVDQEMMFVWVDVGRLIAVCNHEMQRGWRDDPDRILDGRSESEIAVVSRTRRVVQAHGACAERILEPRALAIVVYISGALFKFFGPARLAVRGLYRSNGQAGQRRAIFQEAPAAGFLRIHRFLPISGRYG